MPRNKEMDQWRHDQKVLWEHLPSGPFGNKILLGLGIFTLRIPPTSTQSYPTAYLPFDRWPDFLKGLNQETSNPLDPHEASYVVSRSYKLRCKGKVEEVPSQPLLRVYKCRFCVASFSVGPLIKGEAFELRWKHWDHHDH